jgi:PPP family 3-phenylpropionic acid transporter
MQSDPAITAAPPYYALRMAFFFAGVFLFAGVMLPFFPVWLEARGLTDAEIGSLVAIPIAARVVLTPLAGMFADRTPNRRFAIRLFMAIAVVALLFGWLATGYWSILLTIGVAVIFWSLSVPPGEALALTGVRRFGLDYGRMRFSGSVAFIAANLGAGAIVSLSVPGVIYWLMAIGLLVAASSSLTLPVTPAPLRALDDAERPDKRPARQVLGNPAFLALMTAAGLVHGSHAMLYGFGSIEWQAQGFTGTNIGAFWAIGVACEIALFMWSGRVLMWVGPYKLLLAGVVAAIVRWLAFALDPGLFAILAIQSLHGLTFGATYLGTQYLIARLVPEEMTASAQGIFAMISGLTLAVGTVISGPLYSAYGVDGFYFMLPPAVAALGLLIAFRRFAGT